ncbi:MAG TPA: SEC-C metal-binding domain-containing protein, partial [Candidatus Humimicrobiaceae bacterium]|nr:SEC-C metal-binding domain-containing protein [Candidatus Humimicrobiaceae bacterium]
KRWKEMHEKVVKAGGLHVVGTERHESRRIDNQLRGRSGRQGDPGSSRFHLSLEDDLMRIFGGEQIGGLMDRLHLPEDQPIENKFVSKAIESAQSKVEGFHFDARKSLVEYDDVKNQQREIIYKLRKNVLESKNLKDEITEKLVKQLDKIIISGSNVEGGGLDSEKMAVGLSEIVPFDDASRERIKKELEKQGGEEEVRAFLEKIIKDIYESREKDVGQDVVRQIEKFAYLGSIDHMWIDHLDRIDGIEDAVKLRGYGQRDPLAEFKNEAFSLFEGLIDRIEEELSRRIYRVGITRMPRPEIPIGEARTNVDQLDKTGLAAADEELIAEAGEPAYARASANTPPNSQQKTYSSQQEGKKKIGRNDPCWCGSGKKWKKCHYPQLPSN